MHASNLLVTIAAGVLSGALLSEAAPLVARSEPSSYSYTTPVPSTTTAAAPAYTSSGAPYTGPAVPYSQPVAVVFPDYTSQYNSKTGAVDFHTARGLVSRSPTNGGADITTLVTFSLGTQYSSNMCQLVFDLTDPSSWVSGSKQAQLFTSLAPANTDSSAWPSGNLRNQELGSIDIVPGGHATWEAGSGPGATVNGFFPCSAIAGQIYGGEVVPQGDSVEVSWPAGRDGVKIIVW
uniref:Ubiquitin 3 binding protein But2 C-terminal domain-containing protein n=1 Tax=Anthurium amnicola TaxID=1678845 RepID=A0A1D1ZBA3_9ARAE